MQIMQMLYKPANDFVKIYDFFSDETALVYSEEIFPQGNGWKKVPVNLLYPITREEYLNKISQYREKYQTVESRLLKLGSNIIVTTDSKTFNNLDDAIKHELTLM